MVKHSRGLNTAFLLAELGLLATVICGGRGEATTDEGMLLSDNGSVARSSIGITEHTVMRDDNLEWREVIRRGGKVFVVERCRNPLVLVEDAEDRLYDMIGTYEGDLTDKQIELLRINSCKER